MADLADPIIKRMAERAVILGHDPSELIDQVKSMDAPRWHLSPTYITFNCGCRGERTDTIFGAESWDPIIFKGEREQAVYDRVCDDHAASMNVRLRFGGYADFGQWCRDRRRQLMGKVW